MPSDWRLTPLCFGEFTAFEKSLFTYLKHCGEKLRAPITGWLLRRGPVSILVDTGPSDPAAAGRLHYGIEQTPEQVPDAAVRAAGIAPEDVSLIVLTHLHWDHCYNLERFPAARLMVQADELRAAMDPIPTQRVAYEVGVPGVTPAWLTHHGRLETVRGDCEIEPGVRLVHLPGHTPGLQGVLVETARGRHMIASDALPLRENIEGREPIPPGVHVDVWACLRSLTRIRELSEVALPSHDPAIFDHPSYPAP